MSPDILARIELRDDAGIVVLYDWTATEVQDGRNLWRIDSAGQVLWKAALVAGPPDCFTSVQWDGERLTANTWSCYRVAIDIRDGKVAVLEFTK
jgi:hypothetical protein